MNIGMCFYREKLRRLLFKPYHFVNKNSDPERGLALLYVIGRVRSKPETRAYVLLLILITLWSTLEIYELKVLCQSLATQMSSS